MKNNTFELSYPSDSGFDKTEISFFNGDIQLEQAFAAGETAKRLFVTDTTIARLDQVKSFFDSFTAEQTASTTETPYIARRQDDVLIVLGPGESFKTMDSVLAIVRTALLHNFDRHCIFTAIGGGVICDMTGFAASIFKRGVAVEFVPTTLLAMVDASLGGKTGCDFEGYKNMIGSFYPASRLYVWTSFVQSLPDAEYRSVLAEAVKTALLFSKKMYALFATRKKEIDARNQQILDTMILLCVQAKASVVRKDFRETGQRALLNFGHTFGHALESTAGLGKVTHGDAVAWGIGRALDLSVRLDLCSESYAQQTKKMLALYGWDMNGIPAALLSAGMHRDEAARVLIDAMHKDKKNIGGTMRLILQSGLCHTEIVEVSGQKIQTVLL